MDYDENEFQGQNLHINSEGSDKISPVLRPYALPKFEFGDSIQGSLRFDSLVESENFLGFDSNEDNHWIEEYSRGDSGIQFSSNAAKACSIARHNNVWSEATSSESVEMLLKSVVQEEILPLQSDNKVSDSCDELGCMIKQMESSSNTSSGVSETAQSVVEVHISPKRDSGSNICFSGQDVVTPDGVSGHHAAVVPDAALNNFGGISSMLSAVAAGAYNPPNYVDPSKCKVDTELNEQLSASDSEKMISVSDVAVQNVNENNEGRSVDGTLIASNRVVGASSGDKVTELSEEVRLENDSIMDTVIDEATASATACLQNIESDVETKETEANYNVAEDLHSSQKEKEVEFPEASGRYENKVPLVENIAEHATIGCPISENPTCDNPSLHSVQMVDESPTTSHTPSPLLLQEVGDCKSNIIDKDIDVDDHATLTRDQADDLAEIATPKSVDVNGEIPAKEANTFDYAKEISTGDKMPPLLVGLENDSLYAGGNTDGTRDISNSEGSFDSKVIRSPSSLAAKSKCDEKDTEACQEAASDASINNLGKIPLLTSNRSLSTENDMDIPSDAKVESLEEVKHDFPEESEPCADLVTEKSVFSTETPSHDVAATNKLSLPIGGMCEGETKSGMILDDDKLPGQPSNSTSRKDFPNDDGEQLENFSDDCNANDSSVHAVPLSKANKTGACDDEFFQVEPTSINESRHNEVGMETHLKDHVPFSVLEAPSPSSELRHLNDGTPQVVPRGSVKASAANSRSRVNSERKPRRSSAKLTAKGSTKKSTLVRETSSARLGNAEKGTAISSNPSESAPLQSAGAFHQPFTDLQQLQLRAQIFVYGALIQGIAPDEAYMISAFGGHDVGRSLWDKAWRLCFERFHSSKLNLNTPETPLPPRAGPRSSDQLLREGSLEMKVTSAISQLNNKGTPFLSPMLPFSSPLWSMPTPAETLQSCGLPRGPVADFHRAASPLHPQTTHSRNFIGQSPSWLSQSPYCAPWGGPLSASLHDVGRVPSKLAFEPAQSASAGDRSAQISSASRHPGSVSMMEFSSGTVAEASAVKDGMKFSASAQPVVDTKTSKREKKVSGSPGKNSKLRQKEVETTPISGELHHITPLPIGPVSEYNSENPVTTLAPSTVINSLRVNQDAESRTILPEEAIGKVKEARSYAEEAASIAAAAVCHCQDMWIQMDRHKSLGLLPDNDSKIASAVMAVVAATAVAKAAAAAANVASNAALQAKLMADEAVGNYGRSSAKSSSLFQEGLAKASPASILKGDDGANSSIAILGAARETARRRVEAASKRAENMDAIVKAAELAAEAVSQAGKIVAMGDPLPLSELIAGGIDGIWKVRQAASELVSSSHGVARIPLDNPSKKAEAHGGKTVSYDDLCNDDNVRLIDVLSSKASRPPGKGSSTGKVGKGQKGSVVPDVPKSGSAVPEAEVQRRSTVSEVPYNRTAGITEGSLVEVFKNTNGLKGSWFCGEVVDLHDDKALVCYADLMLGEDKLKEWVDLKSDGEAAPALRLARQATALPLGTRKRRRAANGDARWSVGDKVDALIKNSWSEGVIMEKSQGDDSAYTVHLAASGETVYVKEWHLRPSLAWRNGEWVESSRAEIRAGLPHEGELPAEKRARIKSPDVQLAKEKSTAPFQKPTEPTLLELTASEKIFNVGKSSDNRPSRLMMTRTGLQKEGSKVIFGVPKPGKKRKFMEVSKHYVSSQSAKSNDANEKSKLPKLVMPRGLRNIPRGPPSEKISAPKTAFGRSATAKAKDGHDAEGSLVFSSVDDSRTKIDRASKGKLAPAGGKTSKTEEEKAPADAAAPASDAVEPRRSNRRIQPTSRLLEGLQTSLMVPKLPSASYDKGQKSRSSGKRE